MHDVLLSAAVSLLNLGNVLRYVSLRLTIFTAFIYVNYLRVSVLIKPKSFLAIIHLVLMAAGLYA